MEETGKRPGGLTALAVINFILGGISLLGFFSVVSGLQMRMIEANEQRLNERIQNDPNLVVRDPEIAKQKENLEQTKESLKDPKVKILNCSGLFLAALLIASGVGYLRQKKLLGRTMGNLYAVISILLGITNILIVYAKVETKFSLLSLVGFIYPVLTLFLLNVTFKDDLVE